MMWERIKFLAMLTAMFFIIAFFAGVVMYR